jgi:hypothetical protein
MLSDAVAAFDLAALRGVIALAQSVAGDGLRALNWACGC